MSHGLTQLLACLPIKKKQKSVRSTQHLQGPGTLPNLCRYLVPGLVGHRSNKLLPAEQPWCTCPASTSKISPWQLRGMRFLERAHLSGSLQLAHIPPEKPQALWPRFLGLWQESPMVSLATFLVCLLKTVRAPQALVQF